VPNPIDDARQLIQSRLADLDAEAKSLERALAGLGEGHAPRTRRTGRPRKRAIAATSARPKPKRRAPRKPKNAQRAPRGQRREQLLAAIKANPGARPSELAKAIGIKSAQIHNLIARARAEKLITTRGKGYALKA
jgi:MarR family